MADDKKGAPSAELEQLARDAIAKSQSLESENAKLAARIAELEAGAKLAATPKPEPGLENVGKSWMVLVKHPGGVILPGYSKATPHQFTVKVTQEPKNPGRAFLDVESCLRRMHDAGVIEIKE